MEELLQKQKTDTTTAYHLLKLHELDYINQTNFKNTKFSFMRKINTVKEHYQSRLKNMNIKNKK